MELKWQSWAKQRVHSLKVQRLLEGYSSLNNQQRTPYTLTGNADGGDIVLALMKIKDDKNPEVSGSTPDLATI